MNDYLLAKADYLKEMCDEIGRNEIDEILECYMDADISRSECSQEIHTAFLGSVARDFRKKYATRTHKIYHGKSNE